MAKPMPSSFSFSVQLPVDLTIFALLLVLYAIPWFRPDRRWTYLQAVKVRVIRVGAKHTALLDKKTDLSLEEGNEKDRFVVVKPAPSEVYDGIVNDEVIRPTLVGVTWKPAVPHTSASAVVALHFHGGAYATSTGRDAYSGFAAKMLRRRLGCAFVCSPSYRLSINENGHFPAAFQDAITSYKYLVDEMDMSPSQIILSGDSAGGNLVLALLRYIDEYGQNHGIPLPAAAALWSPWVDVQDALESSLPSKPNYSTDYLTTPFCRWGASAFTKGATLDPAQPYMSPLLHPFSLRHGKVPVFIQTGGREVLYNDNVLLADQMERSGWSVKLFVAPACPHDIMMFGAVLGFEVEAAMAAEKARDYFMSVTKLQLKT